MQHPSTSRLTSARPKICWNRSHLSNELVVRDRTWAYNHVHRSPDETTVTFKSGNKAYVLSAATESTYFNNRTVTSETSLFRKYRYKFTRFIIFVRCL